MIVTLEKLNIIYAQEQKSMPVVMKEVPFMAICAIYAVITAILKIYYISIMIHLLRQYLLSTQSKVTPK